MIKRITTFDHIIEGNRENNMANGFVQVFSRLNGKLCFKANFINGFREGEELEYENAIEERERYNEMEFLNNIL